MLKNIIDYGKNLFNPKFSKPAIKVALFVGTILFIINHGNALIQGEMTKQRLISGILTYIVPYAVNIHGRWISYKL
jgi:hypothetical protein